MTNKFRKALLASASAIALFAALSTGGMADTGTATSQVGTHTDASVFWIGQANGATACNAVSQTSAQDTLTIPAVAAKYAVLTAFTMQINTDATGETGVPTVSFTNIGSSGGLAPILSAASTLSTTSGGPSAMVINFPVGGLKALLPGTAVTAVPSAAMGAHKILCMTAVGYYSD